MNHGPARQSGVEESPERQAAAVQTLLRGCANPGVTRHGLMVRVPDLPPEMRRPHFVRLIEAALDPLRDLDRAGMFPLADGTRVAIWRGQGGGRLQSCQRALNLLFAGLPESPVAPFNLPGDTALLAKAVARSLPVCTPVVEAPARKLDAETLARLEAALSRLDVSPFARRRMICAGQGEQMRLAWEKRYLSARLVAAALAPGLAPRAEPWLFRRLTRSFDRRLLLLLCDPWELRDAGPFALDLNVASIVGPEFLRFDAALPAGFRRKVCLALHPADIFADGAGFAFARDFARARGYRLALRGAVPAWLHVLPPDVLEVDYVEVEAPQEGAPDLPPGVAARTILCGVDGPAALDWGLRQGVTLFEGPSVRPDPGSYGTALRSSKRGWR